MTIEIVGTTVEVLGKAYQLKCPEHEIVSLQKAAVYLQEKMTEIRKSSQVLSIDRVAVLAALSMTHQLLACEREKNLYEQMINDKLRDLEYKLESALSPHKRQLELQPGE